MIDTLSCGADVRLFVDAVMEAHLGLAAAPSLQLLLRCFADNAGDDEWFSLVPDAARPHPEGRLQRHGIPVEIGLPHERRLTIPGDFEARYKVACSGFAAAVQLGFEPADAPVLVDERGAPHLVVAVILDPACVALAYDGGMLELRQNDLHG
jgi:hypothetical protein